VQQCKIRTSLILISLARAEARLDNHDLDQKAAALRADNAYKSFMDRLEAQETNIALLKEMKDDLRRQGDAFDKQNDALQRQIGFRFNFVTTMLGAIGLSLTVIFTYNIYQASKINDQIDNVNKTSLALDTVNKTLTANAAAFSEVLTRLAISDGIISAGLREYQRLAYFDAIGLASSAIAHLEVTYAQVGGSISMLRAYKYDKDKCEVSPPAISATKSPAPIGSGSLSPQALDSVVITSLVEAYDLYSTAQYFYTTVKGIDAMTVSRSKDEISKSGRILMALNVSGWQGYHWVGLAAADKGNVNEAVACYKKSVDYKSIANKDHINLAELYFTTGKFQAARASSEEYLKTVNFSFASTTDAIAHFYLTASNILSPDEKTGGGILTPRDFTNKLRGLPGWKTEGTFSSVELATYFAKPQWQNPEDPKKQEVLAIACSLMGTTCNANLK
jgi:tetratricopeptide (TPR) repeat protein